MNILYITTIGRTMTFFKDFIRQLLDEGNAVDIATNENGDNEIVSECYREWGCTVYPISCSRLPFDMGNIRAIRQIRRIVRENQYDLVHCHTPIAAMCTRFACRPLRKSGVKVFYTAHGFHFYKGAPKKNWLIYYPIEMFCSYFTDVLITINEEDYNLAKKKFHAKKVEYVPGVGIDTKKFVVMQADRQKKRAELGIPKDVVLVLSVGELNENKNHKTAIKAMVGLDVYYIIAGKGEKSEELESLINSQRLQNKVQLIGYRDDVGELCEASDIFLFPSYREGLSVSLMEAMATGLSCVVSRIRGNTDLLDEDGGALFDPHSVEDCKAAIEKVMGADREKMGAHNVKKIRNFDISNILSKMSNIYKTMINF